MKNNNKELNLKDMTLANGGIICYTPPTPEMNAEIRAKRALEEWQKWVRKEGSRLHGIADIRVRAAENALKAAMRIDRQEMEIKEAMRAQHEAFGLD